MMDLNLGLFQQQNLRLNMTQQLTQAISLLQLSVIELTAFIENIAIENPLIEIKTNYYTTFDSRTKKIKKLHSLEQNPIDTIATNGSPSLYDYLHSQTIFMNIAAEERKFLRFLIHNINESGFLDIDINEACELININESLGQCVLTILQGLEPAGIGARNLQECLKLQLDRKDVLTSSYDIILSKYFNEFVDKKWKVIETKTGIPVVEIQSLWDKIQKLNPRPGLSVSNERTEYIVPDIIVEKVKGHWLIEIADDSYVNIRLNKNYYYELASVENSELQTYLKEKYNQFQWLKQSLEQRQDTIKKVMDAIIKRQEEYFVNKQNNLKPMTMQEIAAEIGMHESTVSRTVKSKYLKTPAGIFLLRNLFSSQISEGDISRDTVKTKLINLIECEDKMKPYSDQQIVNELKEIGIKLSRRTITKYRGLLHIPSSTVRKRYECN